MRFTSDRLWVVLTVLATTTPTHAQTRAPAATPMPAATPTPAEDKTSARETYEFKIGPEDSLGISVWQSAELSRVVPVRPDGKISLPLVNDVQAAGLTPMQLRDSLKQKLAEYMPAAEVSVIVIEVHSFSVSVLGKVQRPGRYNLRGPTTVLDALALVGGFAEYANEERILILRPEPFFVQGRAPGHTFKRFYFNYKKVITVGGEAENQTLQSGDILIVP